VIMENQDQYTIDVALALAGAVCEVSSSRIDSHEDRRVSIKLTEDGFEEYIRELGLQEYDSKAENWLADRADSVGGSDENVEGGDR